MTDQELLISTIRQARQIIGEYIEPGPGDAEESMNHLIAVLDRPDLARALERLEKARGLRVVE